MFPNARLFLSITVSVFIICFYALTLTVERANGDDDDDDAVPEYPEYNEDEALKYVFYSKVAFCTERAVASWSCGDMCERAPIVGTDRVRFIREGEKYKVQGYVAQVPTQEHGSADRHRKIHNANDVQCVLSFRGSVNWQNYVADFTPWPLNDLSGSEWCPGCKVHNGIALAYEDIRDDVLRSITELGCTRLVVAGHSLGAAIGTLATFDLRKTLGYQIDATWAFGKPRIGNAEFLRSYVAAATEQGVSPPMWRVVHYHDIIPRLPPKLPGLLEFVHEPLEVYYTNRASSEYNVCTQIGDVENQTDYCMWSWPLVRSKPEDHVDYLNQTFEFKDFPQECKSP